MKQQSAIGRTIRSRMALAALAGCAFAPAGASVAWAGTPAGFKVFTSTAGGYRIEYPASWHAAGAGLLTVIRGPAVQGMTTGVYVDPVGIASTFSSVDALASTIKRSYAGKWTRVSGLTRTRVGGADARVISGQSGSGSRAQGTTLVVFLSHNRAWMISYGAALSFYGKNLTMFQTMLASFSFVR